MVHTCMYTTNMHTVATIVFVFFTLCTFGNDQLPAGFSVEWRAHMKETHGAYVHVLRVYVRTWLDTQCEHEWQKLTPFPKTLFYCGPVLRFFRLSVKAYVPIHVACRYIVCGSRLYCPNRNTFNMFLLRPPTFIEQFSFAPLKHLFLIFGLSFQK